MSEGMKSQVHLLCKNCVCAHVCVCVCVCVWNDSHSAHIRVSALKVLVYGLGQGTEVSGELGKENGNQITMALVSPGRQYHLRRLSSYN